MLRHWSRSVWWCKRKLMWLWNRKTKTVTVTRNLVLELKYDTVNKNNDNDLPGRAGHWDLHLPDRVSYLPRAVGQSLLSYPDIHAETLQAENNYRQFKSQEVIHARRTPHAHTRMIPKHKTWRKRFCMLIIPWHKIPTPIQSHKQE